MLREVSWVVYLETRASDAVDIWGQHCEGDALGFHTKMPSDVEAIINVVTGNCSNHLAVMDSWSVSGV